MTDIAAPRPHQAGRPGTLSRAVAAGVAVLGVLVLVGWTLEIPALKSVIPSAVTMKANTAVAFIGLAVALWLLGPEPRDRRTCRCGW